VCIAAAAVAAAGLVAAARAAATTLGSASRAAGIKRLDGADGDVIDGALNTLDHDHRHGTIALGHGDPSAEFRVDERAAHAPSTILQFVPGVHDSSFMAD